MAVLSADYVKVNKHNERIDIWFYNEEAKPFAVGEKMYALNEEAYMNGYNWDALFTYYLAQRAPELLIGLESDPEAGSYVAYYDRNAENEIKAQQLAELIVYLVENEEELYRLVREEGDQIQWD